MRYVKASGSCFKVGQLVGEASRQDIPEVYDMGIRHLLDHSKAKDIHQIHDVAGRYMRAAKEIWPPAVEYLLGQARAAGVSEKVITFTSFSEEVSTEIGLKPAEKCTSLVVKTEKRKTLEAFGEEFEPHNFRKMVLLVAKFDGFPEVVCFAYPGQLWGSGFSFNANRVSITKNGLHLPAVPGLPTQVVQSRAALARNINEAEEWVMREPVSLPAHYILMSGETGEALSVLVSNSEASYAPAKLHLIRDSFCFTNHIPPGWFNLKAPDPALENSLTTLPRYEKLKSLRPEELPQTPEEAFELFTAPPLFLKPGKPGDSVTMATTVICPEDGEIWIRDADPSAEKRDWHFAIQDEHFVLINE